MGGVATALQNRYNVVIPLYKEDNEAPHPTIFLNKNIYICKNKNKKLIVLMLLMSIK